jgi:resuscitation-promoting factor RpfA
MRMRTLVSSAVIAAAAAAPVVAVAGPSNAASVSTWNRIAQCESSGRWHINTGNGYYGGLQISRGTWDAFGGRRYAALPSRATKGEQIRVADRIQRVQGWGAWPVCSRHAGLR